MMTYNWVITGIDVVPNWNGLSNVVRTIHARYVGTNGSSTAYIVIAADVEEPDPENYLAFEGLTEAAAIAWIEARTDISNLQMILGKMINPDVLPATITVAPPWES